MCLGIPDPNIVCGSRTETVLTSEEDRTGSSLILKHGFFP